MTSTAVRGARGNSQSMGFYLLDIFIRRLLVRLGPDLFGAFSLITTSLRENFALLGRTVLCVFTVVGRYCLRLTCVCLFSFYFSLFRHIYTFRHCFGFTLTSGVGCVFLSRCIFFNNPIFQIRDEFFKNGEFVAMDRVRTTSHFLVTPISLLVGV